MKKYIRVIIIFLLVITCATIGQSQREQRKKEAVTALNQTVFTESIEAFRSEIDYDIKSFQANLDMVSEEDIRMIKKYYTITQEQINQLLDDLKGDFTNAKRQRKILNTPDYFTKKYQIKLEQIRQTYRNDCQQQIHFLIDSPSANPFSDYISDLAIGLVKEVYSLFKNSKKEFKSMSESYFEKEFAHKLRLKDWNEYEKN